MQIIVKEKGIFTNVTSPTSKAKLRLLFEVAPLGLLIEQAGGHSSDGKQSVLDKEITTLDERTQVAYGSKNEIIRFEETLYGSSRLKAETAVGATGRAFTSFESTHFCHYIPKRIISRRCEIVFPTVMSKSSFLEKSAECIGSREE